MTKQRARYVKGTISDRIREVLRKMSVEDFERRKGATEAVKAAGITTSATEISRLKAEILKERSSPNGKFDKTDLQEKIKIVKTAVKRIGSFDELKRTIDLIETVRDIT
jgi:hypothetical protein